MATVPFTGQNRRGSKRTKRFSSVRWWWVFPAVIVAIATHYVAVIVGSTFAFTNWAGIGSYNFIGFKNFEEIFTTPATLEALGNTLIITVIFSTVTMAFGLVFAVALHRGLKSRYVLRIVLFAPVVLSSLTVSYVWKFIFDLHGPLNTVLKAIGLGGAQQLWLGDPHTALGAIIVVLIWQNVGLAMVIFLAGLANIPEEIEEAAAVDGAGTWRRFRFITVPLLRSTILLASTLMLIRGMGAFDQIFALTGGGPYGATDTMTTTIYEQTYVDGRFGYGAALSLVFTGLIIVFAILQITVLRKRED